MTLADLLGAAALCVTASGYALTNDRALRLTALGGLALFLAHMLLIEAWATAGTMALACVMLGSGYAGWRRLSLAGWGLGVAAFPLTALGILAGPLAWQALVPIAAGIVINSSLLFSAGRWLTLGLATGEVLTIWNSWLVGSSYAGIANLMALAALGIRTWRRGAAISLNSKGASERRPGHALPR